MEDINNNMEEFFKRSMDRFDESPSDDVWTNISDRIDLDAKWYDPIIFKLRAILPILLAAMLVASNILYSNYKTSDLSNQLSFAKNKIQTLQNENQSFKTEINNIDEIKNEFLYSYSRKE